MNHDIAYVNVRSLRDQIRDVLENAHYLRQRYVVTHHGNAIAQILSVQSAPQEATQISVTTFRLRTREILDMVSRHGKSYVVSTHGRSMAVICPIPEDVPVEAVHDQAGSVE